ncbi:MULTISPECIES: TnsA endonuclease N-terminal domain-containing protein [Chromobacterium]|uniref:TnsA endonuclease N-terminal domain-containing protein n=1 Tax=Chromobacterium TaxID=535 RepID=UPI000640C1ED|nr:MULTISPECIES: TnsA endonuclease N-terminal domain-containing protein [Chromobacterium]OQS35397.1 hypothetical protein B0T40_13265 [Chromobacterium haemolyticum]
MPAISLKRQLLSRSPGGLVHQRSREVIHSTGGIMRGKFPSRKTGRLVHYEGLLERDAIYLFETSPLVESFAEQPERIYFPDGNKLRRYTPDFVLDLHDGRRVLVEIKPTRSLQQPDVRHKLDCIAAELGRTGQTFLVLSEADLRQQPRLDNLKWIYQHASMRVVSFMQSRTAMESLAGGFPMTLDAASHALTMHGVEPFGLLLDGWLQCDLSEPVNFDTPVTLSMESDHEWFRIAPKYGF